MTRSEREQQILRYLRGDMTSTEEENFFIQVALDRELRDELKAQRAIEGSIRGFRDVERTQQHTLLRARTAAMLSGYPASHGGGALASGGAASSTISGQGMPLRWIVAAMVTVGLTVALFFALPGQDRPVTPVVDRPAVQTVPETSSERFSSPARVPVEMPQRSQPNSTVGEHPASSATAYKPAARETQPRVVSPRANRTQPPHVSQGIESPVDRSIPQHRDDSEPRRSQKGKDSLKVGVDVQIDMPK